MGVSGWTEACALGVPSGCTGDLIVVMSESQTSSEGSVVSWQGMTRRFGVGHRDYFLVMDSSGWV